MKLNDKQYEELLLKFWTRQDKTECQPVWGITNSVDTGQDKTAEWRSLKDYYISNPRQDNNEWNSVWRITS